MTGFDMVTNHLLGLVGLTQEDLAVAKEEIPKLRAGIPAFIQAFEAKMRDFEAKLEALERGQQAVLDFLQTIMLKLDSDAADQRTPPEPRHKR